MVPVLVAALAVAAVVSWQVTSHATDTKAASRPSIISSAGRASTPTPSTSAAPDDQAATRLTSCRDGVGHADDVLAAAKTGVGHWAEHVQAQTDANEGRISVDAMDAIFARTRLAGPEDQARYAEALSADKGQDGSCVAATGASTKEAAALSACRERSDAQQPVLKAADPAMADWKSHLAAMVRSRSHHMDNAEQIWIDTWRAAPPHIRAYQKAADAFAAAPDC